MRKEDGAPGGFQPPTKVLAAANGKLLNSSSSSSIIMNRQRQQKKATKQQKDKNVLTVSNFSPGKRPIANDPPVVERSIRITKRFEGTLVMGPNAITPAKIALAIPGGSTFWTAMRIEKIDVWGSDTDFLSVTVNTLSASAPMRFVDNGVPGAKRCAIGFELGLLERAQFFGPASTTVLADVNLNSGPGIIQYTVELLHA